MKPKRFELKKIGINKYKIVINRDVFFQGPDKTEMEFMEKPIAQKKYVEQFGQGGGFKRVTLVLQVGNKKVAAIYVRAYIGDAIVNETAHFDWNWSDDNRHFVSIKEKTPEGWVEILKTQEKRSA